jgi:two-component system, cell cycle sensor histidine kinase and response regulator CckA
MKEEELARKNQDRNNAIFDHSAVSLWVEDISKLRALIRALRAEQKVFDMQGHLGQHPEFVLEATRMIEVVDVNAATVQLYEAKSKADLIGPLDITLDRGDPVLLASLGQLMVAIERGQTQYRHESNAHTLTGKKLSIIVQSYIPREDDPYPYMLVSVLDITEQRQAEKRVRESEQRYRALVENLGEGLVIADAEENLVFVNPAAEATFGVPAKDIPGMNLRDFLDEKELALILGETEKRKRGETSTYETEIRRPDGSVRNILITATPQFDKGGRFTGTFGLLHDITVRKELERTLERERVLLRTLIDNAPDTIYLKDEKSRFVLANRFLAEFMGAKSPADLIGKTDHDFYPQEVADEFAADEKRVVESGVPVVNKEELTRAADGTLHYSLTTKVPLFDEKGTVAGVVGFGHDITERREAEERLRRSEEQLQQAKRLEAVGRLAGGIAHDFNNLLTVIKGYTDLIEDSLPESTPLKGDLREVTRAAGRAVELTAQLLAFSRKQVLQPRIVNVSDIVTSAEKMLARIIGEDIELRAFCAADAGNVRADPGQIEQALLNLAANSRDAMPRGGKLTLETANVSLGKTYAHAHPEVPPGDYVMLAVSDTGVGMDRRTRARVFEPFFTTKEVGKGTGLGLASVYGTVKQSGGYIFCYSEPGVGTSFKIYFPRVRQAKDAERQSEAAPASPAESETILLVEDEEAIRGFIRVVLEKAGYVVWEARDGSEALAVVSAGRATKGQGIALLLTDVVMPHMNGPQLAAKLREMNPAVKILYMSGYTENAVIHHGMLDPDIDLLQKPFPADELLKRVREALHRSGT